MKSLSVLGLILIIGGLLLSVYGYSLNATVMCNCPITLGKARCQCGEDQESIGHLATYTGIGVTLGGTAFLVYSWRKVMPVGF